MADEKKAAETKVKKLADPVAASIDVATQQMIQRSHELGIETAFDRAVTMKPCNIGTPGDLLQELRHGTLSAPIAERGDRR